jgi:predicted DNA-binding protein (MmcQ/YjbR family)
MTITGDMLQDVARSTATSMPGVTHGRPFVEKLDVYKVGQKVFLIITNDPDEQIITVKVEPEYGQSLQTQYPSIMPGRYLNKHHWISAGAGRGVTDTLIADLVANSYDLVLDTTPRSRWPEDQ